MAKRERGLFIVAEGLDATGKGVTEDALIKYEQKEGRRVYNSIEHSITHGSIPRPKECIIDGHIADTVVSAEPTWAGIGKTIREEMTSSQEQSSSLTDKIKAYSLDRRMQMERLTIPFLEASNNHRIIQSRCLASTLCYQGLEAQQNEEDIDKRKLILDTVRKLILNEKGNQLQLSYPPDLLIILTIPSIEEIMSRIENRRPNKDDKCIFEKYQFQKALKPFYDDPWLCHLFEERGTRVEYINAGVSVEHTRNQAIALYKDLIESKV